MAEGDREALAALYDGHARALFRHAVTLTRSPAQAEDLVQDVFVKLAGLGAGLLGVRSAGAYLHRMLRTAFLDDVRRRAVAAEEPLEECRLAAGTTANAGEDEADRLAIERALAQLPPEQREVIVLHVMQGLTFRELGKATGVTMWTAASRYRLATERLRTLLGSGR
jgi:RNA polymerase sigma-70 factor (ECF subfamily)